MTGSAVAGSPTMTSGPAREMVRDVLAGWPMGSGYYQTSVGVADAAEMAEAVLAELAVDASGIERTIFGVLADHPEGRWSDRGSSCRGCADRFEEQFQRPVDATPLQLREFRRRYGEVTHPGWTTAQWRQHVAAEIAAELTNPTDPDRVHGTAHEPGNPPT